MGLQDLVDRTSCRHHRSGGLEAERTVHGHFIQLNIGKSINIADSSPFLKNNLHVSWPIVSQDFYVHQYIAKQQTIIILSFSRPQ